MTIGSLFSGIGGLEMGLEMLGLGPVLWQCDADPYARAVLAHHWPNVHRFDDVRSIDATAPRPDIICGGFPCQDISNAGKRAGIRGARSGLWSEFARIIRVLRPRIVFVENVAALAARGLDRVLGDLAALGFDAEWDCFSAAEVGAPHIRRRLFVLAYASGKPFGLEHRRQRRPGRQEATVTRLDGGKGDVADPDGVGWNTGERDLRPGQPDVERRGRNAADARREPSNLRAPTRRRHADAAAGGWWSAEPDVGRVAHGIPARAHRLRLLGNACVPQQAAHAFRALMVRASAQAMAG